MKGIFSELIVLELANVLAGPSVGQFFAELGARVIKLENSTTNGDVTRTWKMPGEPPDELSSYFHACNWGKESIAVNLKTDGGKRVMHDLVRVSDVVISSFLPSAARKMQADYETFRAINPDIICGSIVGYSPESERPGYDAIAQAEAGYYAINGNPSCDDGKPTKLPVAFTDIFAGHQLKEALLVALIRRMKTGKGANVHVSLFDAAISALANQATNWLVGGVVPGPMGSAHPNIAPYGSVFTDLNGDQIVLAVGTDRQFDALCTVLDRPDVAGRDEFSTNTSRVTHRERLDSMLSEAISKQERDSFLTACQSKGIPAGAIRSMDEVFDAAPGHAILPDAGGIARGVREFALWPTEREGISETVLSALSEPPHFGHHTRKVLTGLLGYTSDTIDRLAADSAIILG